MIESGRDEGLYLHADGRGDAECVSEQRLIVGVDGQRRTIMLPPAMAAMRPAAATFEAGALQITFDGERRGPRSQL